MKGDVPPAMRSIFYRVSLLALPKKDVSIRPTGVGHSSMHTRTLYKIRVSYERTFQNIRYAYDTYLMANTSIADRGA